MAKKISDQESMMLNLRHQMGQNNDDLKNFLQDMDGWESEIKTKDEKLKKKKPVEEQKLPPVRNSLDKKKTKKVKKSGEKSEKKPKRISSYDYRSWDKFDVDKACESDGNGSSTGSEYETDEEWEVERKKQAAVMEKDKGNDYFKRGDYDKAIECYTTGADFDPTHPLLPANRAMALLKQDKFAAAELDCSIALTLDPLYTKAYLRRGTARMGLHKYLDARSDYEKVLQLEPQNKKAKSDMDVIEKELTKQNLVGHTQSGLDKNIGVVKAIFKQPHERSKRQLVRMDIEEVGLDEHKGRKSAVSMVTANQSQAKQNIMEKQGEMFQKFTAMSPGDISMATLQKQTTDIVNGDESSAQSHVTEMVDNRLIGNRVSIKMMDKSDVPSQDKCVNNVEHDHVTKSKVNVKEVSNVKSPPSTSPRQLSVPTTSIQFQTDYKGLKNNPEAFFQYFKNIRTSEFPKLFGQFLDAEVLINILNIIKAYYVPFDVDFFETLASLTTVKRFSMVAMFFSKKEKQVLKDIFTNMRSCGKYTEEEIKQLASKYDVR